MTQELPRDHVPTREELDTPNKHGLSHQREERCVPFAHRLIKLLAEQEKMPVGAHVVEAVEEKDYYAPTMRTLFQEMLEADVKLTEVVYIFTLARQALDMVQSVVDETLNQNMNRNTETMYGLKHNDYDNVTLKQLNAVVMRRHLLADVWKPVLEAPVENDHPISDTGLK